MNDYKQWSEDKEHTQEASVTLHPVVLCLQKGGGHLRGYAEGTS